MGTKIPFQTQMQIIRRRLQTTLQATCEEFGVSRSCIVNIMKRHEDIVDEVKARLRADAVEAIYEDAKESERRSIPLREDQKDD